MIAFVWICFGIHLLYWILIFSRVSSSGKTDSTRRYDGTLSIVVCVKDDASALSSLIPLLRKQDCDEVIIVNDYSSDDTAQVIKDSGYRMIVPQKDLPGKKHALEAGIRAATSDYVLLTDVDCDIPPRWAAAMKASIDDHDLILGYSPMKKRSGIVPLFSRYETFHTAIQYLGYHISGITYMGVGRNLLVRREAALQAMPYVLASDMASGDDDLLVNHLASNHSIGYCLDDASFVRTEPKTTLHEYIIQKSRHISTASTYSSLQKGLLAVYSATQMTGYTLLIILVITGMTPFTTALLILSIKWIIQMIVSYTIMKKLRVKELFPLLPFLDILMYLYLIVLSPYIFVKNNKRWS